MKIKNIAQGKIRMYSSNSVALAVSSVISLVLSLAVLSYKARLSIPALLSQIKDSYYFPYIASAKIGAVGSLHFHILVYCAILGSVLVIMIRTVLSKTKASAGRLPFYKIVWLTGLIFFSFVLILQTGNHYKRFMVAVNMFRSKTLHEKYGIVHLVPYKFADFCRKGYQGKHRGQLITDMDISREPFMWGHRVASYHLYPTIDIRNINKTKPVDCLVILKKKNPEASIPKNFFIWKIYNKFDMLAIKKEDSDGID